MLWRGPLRSTIDDEKRPKRCHRDCKNAYGTFYLDPESRPYLVVGSYILCRYAADQRNRNHDNAEAKHSTNAELLSDIEMGFPQKTDGYRYD